MRCIDGLEECLVQVLLLVFVVVDLLVPEFHLTLIVCVCVCVCVFDKSNLAVLNIQTDIARTRYRLRAIM